MGGWGARPQPPVILERSSFMEASDRAKRSRSEKGSSGEPSNPHAVSSEQPESESVKRAPQSEQALPRPRLR